MDNTSQFVDVTVFVMASNETDILRETVSGIRENCSDADLDKIVIVAKNDSCPAYYEAQKIITESDGKILLYVQKAPNVVLCIAELPPLAEGSHFVIMAGDMEMHPDSISDFVAQAKLHPERIICAAKWLSDSCVEGYGFFHSLCSKAMNKFISILFNADVKDPFSIYQIYPVSVYRKMNFRKDENFLFEYTLKPLHYGCEYSEVPTVYKKRSQGKSNFDILTLFKVGAKFCCTAIKIKAAPKR